MAWDTANLCDMVLVVPHCRCVVQPFYHPLQTGRGAGNGLPFREEVPFFRKEVQYLRRGLQLGQCTGSGIT